MCRLKERHKSLSWVCFEVLTPYRSINCWHSHFCFKNIPEEHKQKKRHILLRTPFIGQILHHLTSVIFNLFGTWNTKTANSSMQFSLSSYHMAFSLFHFYFLHRIKDTLCFLNHCASPHCSFANCNLHSVATLQGLKHLENKRAASKMCSNVWEPAPRILGCRAHFSLSFTEKKRR